MPHPIPVFAYLQSFPQACRASVLPVRKPHARPSFVVPTPPFCSLSSTWTLVGLRFSNAPHNSDYSIAAAHGHVGNAIMPPPRGKNSKNPKRYETRLEKEPQSLKVRRRG